ncbi:thioredoxin family protein (plasmid) [Cereibacter azotoformans]|uniref:thioredoxin family protein n=1 Tax=Cereibacter azotoformans TaxID=43057 RepID=UPI001EECAB80|nr:thioredoxin family protein [Cereibacter azotoformans]ULB12481.1 thioredoxin family protein [Cereibacter azotoformans]
MTRARILKGLGALLVLAAVGLFLFRPEAAAPPPPGADPVAAARTLGLPVVAEFGAQSCAACREMQVTLSELKQSHGDRLSIVEVDFTTAAGRALIRAYRIKAIPTQIFYDAGGQETGRHLGAVPAAGILERLGLESREAGNGRS